MALNKIEQVATQRQARSALRNHRNGLVQEFSSAGLSADQRALLAPHVQAVVDVIDARLTLLTAAMEAIVLANAEKVALGTARLAELTADDGA